jgi:hypothetical protein
MKKRDNQFYGRTRLADTMTSAIWSRSCILSFAHHVLPSIKAPASQHLSLISSIQTSSSKQPAQALPVRTRFSLPLFSLIDGPSSTPV